MWDFQNDYPIFAYWWTLTEALFSKDTYICHSWVKSSKEKTVKGIIFKGSVSTISSIMTYGRTFTEVVEEL